MLNKYGLGSNHELNIYYRSEHMENTDFSSYENINPKRPDAFVGFTSDIFISPLSIVYELENKDNIEEYSRI